MSLADNLTEKDRRWLRACEAAVTVDPGVAWERAPMRFRKLERLGLVEKYFLHGDKHQPRAVLTTMGFAHIRAESRNA
jgi:hypothetical protein